MHDVLRPLELMLLCLAGVLTEREHVINLHVREENRILREQMGKRPRPSVVVGLCVKSGSADSLAHTTESQRERSGRLRRRPLRMLLSQLFMAMFGWMNPQQHRKY